MPMSSAEIAAQAMQNYQQYQMMNQMHGAYGPADMLAGGLMNSIQPMASGVAGTLGLTPSSIMMGGALTGAFGAGAAAYGAGAGIGGIASAGLGGAAAGLMGAMPLAGVAYLGGQAASFAGGQMLEGAREQQALNATLARSFTFPNQYGGKGFTRSDTSQIGSLMRHMSHEVGPMGELTSMRELTDIAGKMGQMGMGRGVRDASEFSQKFRELIKTVKGVATELNTSLGQAMEFMQASKSSGMFTTTDQARFARMANQTAIGSGMAISEVTAMANIGSQISRSVGGLGRAGAMGGMRAAGQVGAALQSGVLTEEQIYNATGLTGEEGRQAMATNMMSQSASFLQSGRGRRFLASVAGANGQLDQADVAKYMLGGVGTGDTMRMAHQNLRGIGRANFIRNEGRLRGAALEQFGGQIPAMALMGWASQRGLDINDMDDRSMLFAQRQLGMGRDELDAAVQMAQNLPTIMRQQQQTQEYSALGQRQAREMKMGGVQGMQRRFEHAKERLTSGLKQAGQDIYNDLTNAIDGWINSFTGSVIEDSMSGISEEWRKISNIAGTREGDIRMQMLFGPGKGTVGAAALENMRGLGGGGGAASAAFQRGKPMTWEQFSGQATGPQTRDMFGLLGKGVGAGWDYLTGKGEYAERARAGGYGGAVERIGRMGSEEEKNAATTDLLQRMNRNYRAIKEGGGRIELGGGALEEALSKEYALGPLGRSMTPEARVAEYRRVLEGQVDKDPRAAQILQQMDRATPENQIKIVRATEDAFGQGTKGDSLRGMAERMGPLESALRDRSGMTQRDRLVAFGSAFTGTRKERTALLGLEEGGGNDALDVVARVGAGILTLGLSEAFVAGGKIADWQQSEEDKRIQTSAATFIKSAGPEGGAAMLNAMVSDDRSVQRRATRQADELIRAAQAENASEDDRGRGIVGLHARMRKAVMDAKGDWKNVPAEDKRAMAEAAGRMLRRPISVKDLESMASTGEGVMQELEKQVENDWKEKESSAADERAKGMEAGGLLQYDAGSNEYILSPAKADEARKAAGQTGLDILNLRTKLQNDLRMGRISPQEAYNLQGEINKKFSDLTDEQRKAMTGVTGSMEDAARTAQAKQLGISIKRKGLGGALGAAFGAGGTPERDQALKAAFAKGDLEGIQTLITQGGLGTAGMRAFYEMDKGTGEAARDAQGNLVLRQDVRTAMDKARRGNAGDLSRIVEGIQSDPGLQEEKRKEKFAQAEKNDPVVGKLGEILGALNKMAPATGAEAAKALKGVTVSVVVDGKTIAMQPPPGGGTPPA